MKTKMRLAREAEAKALDKTFEEGFKKGFDAAKKLILEIEPDPESVWMEVRRSKISEVGENES